MTGRRFASALLLALLLAAPLAAGVLSGMRPALAAEPESVRVRAGMHEAYARLVFDWSAPVGYSATVEGRSLRVHFDRPLTPAYAGVRRTLQAVLADIALAEDGQTVVATLKGDFTARGFTAGNRVVVDLTSAATAPTAAETPSAEAKAAAPRPLPPAERDAASGPDLLKVRAGHHRKFGRLVFEWPRKVGFTVDRRGQSVAIRFAAPARIDLEALRKDLPSQISAVLAQPSENELALKLLVPQGAQLRYFHNRSDVVFDVVASSRPRPADPQPAAKPEEELQPAAAAPAADEPPTALPPRLVSVDARRSGDTSEIRFNWRRPVAAAVYRREGRLWIVFDRPARLDLGQLRILGGNAFAGVAQRRDARSVQVRMPLGAGFHSTVRRDGTVWVVTLSSGEPKPVPSVKLKVVRNGPGGTALHVLTGPPGRIVAVQDPDVGDRIVAVTRSESGTGLRPVRRFPEFQLLQSDHGLAIRPLDDALRVERQRDRIVISRPGGLSISSFKSDSLAARVAGGDELMVDLARWRFGPITEFQHIEHELLRATLLPEGRQRNAARLALARFYVGHGMGSEAIGVIAALLRDDPEMIDEPSVRALRGVANYMVRHFAEATADLEHLSLAGVREIYPWRAGIAAARGDWEKAHELFRDTDPVIAGMPPRHALAFGLLAAEASLSVDDLDAAETRLAALSGYPASGDELDQAAYLRGHLLKKRDQISRARKLWQGIIETGGRQGRAKAKLADVTTALELKEIEPAEAIEELEKLRFAWRNGVFEFDLLQTLGRLYADVGDLRRSLVTLREAATYFKDIKGVQNLTEDMRRLFRRFYLDGEADRLRPVVALGLYNEFRELTPSGRDGDRMIRKLAERLIDVDLLNQAAELLEHQVRYRLAGTEKIETGTRLAQILLMDDRPADAVEALDISDSKDMPADSARDRRFMRAEAQLKMKRPKAALATIARDHDDRFDLLRAQIYWQSGKWNDARLVLARLTGGFDPLALNEARAQLVLRRAVALRLARNEPGIAFLRDRFADGMDKTKLGPAFKAVVGRPVDGAEDFEELARQAAELDTFVAFLDALYGRPPKKQPETAQSS